MDNRLFEEKDWNYYTTVIPIMLFVIIFLLWAAFTKIDETIKGTGKVVPSGQTKVIQNLEGGIVSAILVNEGDNVKKGDTIYNLSNAFFSADSITKEIDLLTFQVQHRVLLLAHLKLRWEDYLIKLLLMLLNVFDQQIN